MSSARLSLPRWTTVLPLLGVAVLALTWGRDLGALPVAVAAAVLAGSVLAAVHHAEVVAHRVGEPFGSLVLAVAVTVIEVALIITLMLSGGKDVETLARDTVFAAVMITLNGIVGLALLAGTLKRPLVYFNAEGAGGALATVATLATTCLVLPSFTLGEPGPRFTAGQLAFAAVVALALYGLFVITQTVRHRDFFLPVSSTGEVIEDDRHADPPSDRAALTSLGLLLVSLVAVVGLAKILSPSIEAAVRSAGLPPSFVGVIIALLVLLPESIAAVNAARRKRMMVSLNLAYGSAMASIGLTVPAIAISTLFVDIPLSLGLGETQMVLLALTLVVSVLTVVPGRATRLQAGVHLVLLAAFIFLAMNP
ncbi:MAG: ionic transporter y4hA [Micrococcales bacterium]|nr:ionic transporter y4hA [Micrococcales bacterium]